MASRRVTVTTAPTRLSAPVGRREQSSMILRCPDAPLHIGGPDVTLTTSYVLPADVPFSTDRFGDEPVYARVTPVIGTAEVMVFETTGRV